MSNSTILLVVTPLFTAFVLSATALPQKVRHTTLMRIRNLISLSGMSILCVVLIMCAPDMLSGRVYTYTVGGWSPFLGVALRLDAFSFLLAVVSVLVCFLALFYSIPHMGYMRRMGRYDAFYFLMVSGILGVLLTRDVFNMYVFFEILSISVYVLITSGERKESYKASLKYLILGSLSSALFLFAVGIIYAWCGSLNMDYAAEGIRLMVHKNPALAYVLVTLILVSLGVKTSVVPLHFWLPDAHSIAPTPISAVLSGIVLKISVYAMMRLFALFGPQFYFQISPAIAYTGGMTVVVGTLLALVQKDIKRMLAYSSISQIGIIITGIGIGTDLALKGALFHVMNHAFMKSGLFLCAGIIAGQSRTKEISNLRVRTPGVAVSFVLFSLGIIGVPPLNGFVSKFIVCYSAVEAQYYGLAVIILATSVVACGYYFRVVQTFFREKKKRKPTRPKSEFKVSKFMSLPVYTLAILCVILGLLPLIGLKAADLALTMVGG